jgi:hypothetical protein
MISTRTRRRRCHMDVEKWRTGTLQDRFLTDIANNEERMGGRFGYWASDPDAEEAVYNFEVGGRTCRVTVKDLGPAAS